MSKSNSQLFKKMFIIYNLDGKNSQNPKIMIGQPLASKYKVQNDP